MTYIKKIGTGLRIFLSWTYVLILVLFIFFSLRQRMFSTTVGNGTYQARTVLSSSMEPSLPVGSLLITKQVPKNQLKVDDIIVFKANDDFLAHRIIQIFPDKIITKGDANDYTDGGEKGEIRGKMILSIPKIGHFFLMIQYKAGKIALLLTLINLLLIDYLIKLLCIEWMTMKKGLVINENQTKNAF